MSEEAKPVREWLSTFGESELVDWLRQGLIDYYSRSNENAFGRLSEYIGKLDTLSDDLAWIYDNVVPAQKQRLFRRAIPEILKDYAADLEFPAAAVRDLVYLIPKVNAVEALRYLPIVVGAGRVGQEKHWLLFESIAQIKQLLPRTPAIEALYSMVTSRGFDDLYAFGTLTALCIKDPHHWPAHFKLLSGSLSRRLRATEADEKAKVAFEGERDRFFRVFLEKVSLEDIKRHLNEDDLAGINERECRGAFRLLRELLEGPLQCRALRYERDKNIFMYKVRIFRKDLPEPQIEIDVAEYTEYLTQLFGEPDTSPGLLLALFNDYPLSEAVPIRQNVSHLRAQPRGRVGD